MSVEKFDTSHAEEAHGHDSHINVLEQYRKDKAILLDVGASQAKAAASHLKLGRNGHVSLSFFEFSSY